MDARCVGNLPDFLVVRLAVFPRIASGFRAEAGVGGQVGRSNAAQLHDLEVDELKSTEQRAVCGRYFEKLG